MSFFWDFLENAGKRKFWLKMASLVVPKPLKGPSLARSVPKPLKVPSLARSVSKALKGPSLARSVPKPLKGPSLARSVPKPLKVPSCDELKWNEANFGSLIFMKLLYVIGGSLD